MTKLHEEFLRGPAADVRREIEARGGVKGEIVLLVAGGADAAPAPETPVEDRIARADGRGVSSRMDAIKQTARERGVAKRDVYGQAGRAEEPIMYDLVHY